MRNPLRNLVARPSDKPTIRERVTATRERLASKLRPNRATVSENSVSPELMVRIAECLSANAALQAISDDDFDPTTHRSVTDRAGQGRNAVALFRSTSTTDTWAKARCLAAIYRRDSMQADIEYDARTGITFDGFAVAIAAEVIDLTASADASVLPVPTPDPILALIEEAWRLTREHGRLNAVAASNPDDHPSWEPEGEAHAAMWKHVRGVLLKTVPTTAAGCVALARFACAFTEDQGVPLEYEGNDPVLALIARSPAL